MRTSQFPLLSLTPFLLHSQLILKKFVVLSWKVRNPVDPSQISGWGSTTQLVFLRRCLGLVGKLQEFAGGHWSDTRDR